MGLNAQGRRRSEDDRAVEIRLRPFRRRKDRRHQHVPAQGRARKERGRRRLRPAHDRASVAFSVRSRWLVVVLLLAARGPGAWSLTKLPIDAVPDITNNQVQINMVAPALSPVEIEKQVTFPIETALAGIPGLESTRSFSRNGFAQITAVFTDRTDIYFARQQVSERLTEAKASLPPGVERARWVRSRPASARSIGGPSNMCRPVNALAGGTESRAGRATAAISPRKASASPTTSSAPSICARCRTGSSGRK